MVLKRIAQWGLAVVLLVLAAFTVAYWRSGNTCGRSPAPSGALIKAVVYCDYGPPDVLQLAELEKPTPGDDELLIKVHAASLNPLEWHYMRGTPYLIRLGAGLRKPEDIRLGVDYSGTVEAVGRNVTQFTPGDEVFGARNGALAQYIVARVDGTLARKPPNISFEQAASVAIAAITALQALRDVGAMSAGDAVLINGASGGVGTFAVQIAKAYGAEVTAVNSTRNIELVRSIGADHVFDYTRQDFTQARERYDLILDCVGNRSLAELRSVLKPDGTAVLIGGGGPDAGAWIGPIATPIKAALYSPFFSQRFVTMLADLNPKDLATLRELMEAGKLTPVVDRQYPLEETAQAMRYLEAGHARGKVIVTMP